MSNSSNTGAWYYDFPLWRVDHNFPQSNNFCQCVSNSSNTCILYFTEKGDMFIDFPSEGVTQRNIDIDTDTDEDEDEGTCCKLCDVTEGCSTMKPDWLSAAEPPATINGTEKIDGFDEPCTTYCIPGFQAVGDCLSYTPSGQVCRYSELLQFAPTMWIQHNLTFTNFSAVPPIPSDMQLPSRCKQNCPRMFPQCMEP